MSHDDDHEENFGLIVSFPDQSPSFTHGFEAGQLWSELETTDESEFTKTLHSENHTVIERMALEKGWDVEFSPTGYDEWQTVRFVRGKKITDLPNPHGLRVIQ